MGRGTGNRGTKIIFKQRKGYWVGEQGTWEQNNELNKEKEQQERTIFKNKLI